MRWPLRRKLFAIIASGVVMLAVVMAVLVDRTVVREINATENQNLEHTRTAFESLQAYRRDQLLERCRLVSDLPYFKAAAAVFDPSLPLSEQTEAIATVREVALRILSRVNVDLLAITTTSGEPVLVEGQAVSDPSRPIPGLDSLVRRALQHSNAEGVVALDKGIAHLTAVPLSIGGFELGTLALGTLLSTELTNSLESMTGSAVALLGPGGLAAASRGVPAGAEAELLRAWNARSRNTEQTLAVKLGKTTYRTQLIPLLGPRGNHAGAFVIMRSEAPAVAFRSGVREGVVGISAGAVIVALLLSFFFSRHITTPLRALVAFTERVGQGDLEARVDIRTGDEMQALGDAFNRMTEGLAESRRGLVQAGKMAAFGELGAGIAHELRQPLSSIRGFAQLIRMRLGDSDHGLAKYPDLIMQSVDHMTTVVQGLKDFARKASFTYEEVSVNQAVERTTLLMASQLANHGITLENRLDPGLPSVRGDLNQLQQVFTNLVANARDAMPEGGQVLVETTLLPQKQLVLASVTDTGPGIPEDILPKIFGSFFTTKPEGKGTGLGLSITQGIVKDHGGRIEVTSRVGAGTTFRIYLPVSATGASHVSASGAGQVRPTDPTGTPGTTDASKAA